MAKKKQSCGFNNRQDQYQVQNALIQEKSWDYGWFPKYTFCKPVFESYSMQTFIKIG